MELNGQFSKLRQMVMESGNPELRTLESQLLQSWSNKLNHDKLLHKEAHQKQNMAEEAAYGAAVKQCDALEREQCQLEENVAREHSAILAMYQQEQKYSRSIAAAEQQCAEVVMDMALHELNLTEDDHSSTDGAADAAEVQLQLQLHEHKKTLKIATEQLMEQQRIRDAAQTERLYDLKQRLQEEEHSLKQLQQNIRVVEQGDRLARQAALEEEVSELRVAVAEAELQEHQRLQELDKKQLCQHLQQHQTMQLQQQIRLKIEAAEKEKRQEAEYLKILREIQALECDLEMLNSACRKRRTLQQRHETETLLRVRAAEREKKRLQLLQEDELQQHQQLLRSSLSVAEEQRVLLQFAPHLVPHLTPALRERLGLLAND